MKNKIVWVTLLSLLIVCPIFATTQYSVYLNGISYTTQHPLIEKNDTLYISLEELAIMTLSPLEHVDDSYTLTLHDSKVSLRDKFLSYSVGNEKKVLPEAPFSVDDLLYVPVTFLDDLDYPYTLDLENNIFTLEALTPYSRNVDKIDNHTFKALDESLKVLPAHVNAFCSDEAVAEALNTALLEKQYIAFMDNSSFETVYNSFNAKFSFSPYSNIQVTIREIDTQTYPNKITRTTTLPAKVKMSPHTFKLSIGDEQFDYPMIWPTFYPSKSFTDQDLTKTIDVTLMHALYEYYRNHYDLRDDIYFSPFTTVTSDRTGTMSHDAYSLSVDKVETHYTVKVYRTHPSGSIHYMIDIIAK